MTRQPGFDLLAAARQPSFTPAVRDLPALLALLDGDPATSDERAVERAVARTGLAGPRAVVARLPGAPPPLRGRLVRLLGRLAAAGDPDGALGACLIALAADADAKSRKNALAALGRLHGPEVSQALLAAWAREERPDHRRTIAEALGKAGGEAAQAALDGAAGDPELERIAAQARSMLRRSLEPEGPAIDLGARPDQPRPIVLSCRRGLEALLVEELGEIDRALAPQKDGPGRVAARLAGPIGAPASARIALSLGFPLPPVSADPDPAIAAGRALAAPETLRLLAALGAVRYRLEWKSGRRRGAILRAVREVGRLAPSLVNDPSARAVEVLADERDGQVWLELRPRLDDARFAWRVADVPAASHPTIAAALARVAGARADDVVWDPFVGSAAELIERARLGGVARSIGSDLDERALDAARKNLAAARVSAELIGGDALAVAPRGVTLILTNPPLGRRVHRRADLADLLERFVAHAARLLAPGGRLVWISPHGARTLAAAERAGLAARTITMVDLGGFEGALQRFDKARRANS